MRPRANKGTLHASSAGLPHCSTDFADFGSSEGGSSLELSKCRSAAVSGCIRANLNKTSPTFGISRHSSHHAGPT
jgi:hypothetical protein